jgi:hypothetical protein
MQFFPSDEIITSLIKTGAKKLELPSGSKLRVGGLSYEVSTILHLDFGGTGAGGLDVGVLQNNALYYIYMVLVDAQILNLVGSLNASKPEGFNSYRRIGKVSADLEGNISVVTTDFVTEVQQSQIETINLELSQTASKSKTNEIKVLEHEIKIDQLDQFKVLTEEKINTLTQESLNFTENFSEVLSKIATLESESAFNTEHLVVIGNKVEQADVAMLEMAVSLGERQAEYLSLKNISNGHAAKLNVIDLQFNSTLGHRHDGKDSPLIDVVDLSSAGGEPGDVLSIDNQNKLQWVSSNITFKKEMSICWVENASSSPVKIVKTVGSAAAFSCYELGIGGNGKKMFSSFKVPVEFKTGNTMKVNFLAYHEGTDVSKTYQFTCSAYLIKKDSAPGTLSTFVLRIGSPLNATQVAQIKEHSFLLSFDGKIDSQEVLPGDLIYIAIEKVNTGSTEDSSSTVVLDSGLSVIIES